VIATTFAFKVPARCSISLSFLEHEGPAQHNLSAVGRIFRQLEPKQHHSGDLPHPSARLCHLVSIITGAIGGRRRPSQRAGLRYQFSGRDQLSHKRRISPETALMRQRRPAQGRYNRNQCASGARGNAADFGNRHRKIQRSSVCLNRFNRCR
jgi:hypothetical protein